MNVGVVSMRYARALLAYAKSQHKEELIYKEVKVLAAHFSAVPELRRAIENPVVRMKQKLALLCEAAGGETVSQEMQNFFRLVLEAKREKCLQFMIWSYIDLYREDKHILVGRLTTATAAVSDRLASHLSQLVSERTQGEVEMETKVDKNLIGGYVIELGGFRLDASVSNQLKRVRRQFLAKNKRIV